MSCWRASTEEVLHRTNDMTKPKINSEVRKRSKPRAKRPKLIKRD